MRSLFLGLFLLLALPAWAAPESQIAKLVESAPEVKSESELPKLVKQLTKSLKKEEEKAYVLLAWIVQNIDYDDYKKNQIKQQQTRWRTRSEVPESGDILKTRLGVCADIAALYKKMLEQAGMKAVIINGCIEPNVKKTKKCQKNSPRHSWNAAWINNQWELIDPTWAITGQQVSVMEDITKKRNYEKELKKREKRTAQTYQPRKDRSVNKQWFMTSPKTMEEDHFPDDDKWLLTKTSSRRNKNL